jgi:hypothetical protein
VLDGYDEKAESEVQALFKDIGRLVA